MKTRIVAGAWAAMVRTVAIPALFFMAAAMSAPASADDGPQAAARAKSAVQAFAVYVQETAHAHRRPDYSRPPISQYLQHILDIDAFAALPPVQSSDIPWLLDWSASVSQTQKMLLFFGATSNADMKDAVALNVAEAEDHIIRATALELRIGSRLMRAMPLFMAALPPEPAARTATRQAGVQRAKQGYMEIVQGAVASLSSPLKPGNALLLAAAVCDTVVVWAPLTTASERAELSKLLKQGTTANAYPEVMDALSTASATLSNVKN
jgi:hypothetical protein